MIDPKEGQLVEVAIPYLVFLACKSEFWVKYVCYVYMHVCVCGCVCVWCSSGIIHLVSWERVSYWYLGLVD